MKPATVRYPLTIYFDGSCRLCAAEIALLSGFDARRLLRFVDCSPPSFAAVEGYSRAAMMALIHGRDAAGVWWVGAPVLAAAYRVTGFALIAHLWGSRWLQPLWRVVYPWVARNRAWLSRLGAVPLLTWALQRLHARAAQRTLAVALDCATHCVGVACGEAVSVDRAPTQKYLQTRQQNSFPKSFDDVSRKPE